MANTRFLVQCVRESAPGLEIHAMLILSTGHITGRTAELFRQVVSGGHTYEGRTRAGLPIFYEKSEYGWIVPIIGSIEETCDCGCPDDLYRVLEFAHENGCTWVMLDQDADTVEGLPVYDW